MPSSRRWPTIVVRGATAADVEALQEVERDAGQRFRDIGMDWIAEDEPLPAEELSCFIVEGRAWVAVVNDVGVVGYVLAEDVDGAAHIEQISVRGSFQGQGIGRLLIDQVEDWARSTGRGSITLTTFRDVPWNRALYEHLGFRIVPDEAIGVGLAAVVMSETAHGLDPATRIVMRRVLQ